MPGSLRATQPAVAVTQGLLVQLGLSRWETAFVAGPREDGIMAGAP
jgi:hypothetical protein